MRAMTSDMDAMKAVADRLEGLDGCAVCFSADIHVPTLVIHGDEDIMVPCYEGRKVSDLIPDSRFLLLKGQGHGIPVKAYAESLLEFISEHPIAERRRPCGRPRSSPRYPCG